MKNTNKKQNEFNWISIIAVIIIMIIMELFGAYCKKHEEEIKQKDFEYFKNRNAEMMNMVDWNKAKYH